MDGLTAGVFAAISESRGIKILGAAVITDAKMASRRLPLTATILRGRD
jgi:hypothetical protein